MNKSPSTYLLIVFSLLVFQAVQSQEAVPSQGSQRALNLLSQIPHEKIFVHTDKPLYVVGETLWFSLYCVDADAFTPSMLSTVAYVELINNEGSPILQEKVRLDQGRGNGHFFLSGEVKTGHYVLRAYTHWMQNWGSSYFYEVSLPIFHPTQPFSQVLSTTAPTQSQSPNLTPTSPLKVEWIQQSTGYILSMERMDNSLEEARVLLHSQGNVQDTFSIGFDAQKKQLSFESEKLGSENYEILVFDKEENLLARQTLLQVHPDSPALAIHVENSEVFCRDKVRISFSIPDSQRRNIASSLSVSVHKMDLSLPLEQDDILSALENPAHVNLAHPWGSLLPAFPEPGDSLHKRVLASFTHTPEIQAPFISGKVAAPSSNLDTLFVSFPGKYTQVYPVYPDRNGIFQLEVSPALSSNEMVFWAADSLKALSVNDPFSPTISIPKLSYAITPEWKELVQSYTVNSQIANLYLDSTHIRGKDSDPGVNGQPFYGVPRFSYLLDEYTRFPNLDEVFLEYVRYAMKRKIGTKRYVFVWDEYANALSLGNSIPFKQPALVLIDGIPIRDPDFLWNFDVFKIKQLDLVTKKFFLGNIPFYGVANFITYDHNFGGEKLPENLQVENFMGLQRSKNFYAPDYGQDRKPVSRIPDFRSTLYWNPDLRLDSNEQSVEFFSSDDQGTYLIVVNGLREDGTPLYAEKLLFVKRHEE